MKEILNIKADFCAYFNNIDSASSRLVEAVQGHLYWSSSLPPYLAATTKPQFYPGRNELGSILESVRFDIMKEAVLSQTFLDISIENEDQSLMESVNTTVNYIVSESHDFPSPLISPIDRNSHNDEHTPPPPTHYSNELMPVPDVAHHINIDRDNDPSLIVTQHNTNNATGVTKSTKEETTVKSKSSSKNSKKHQVLIVSAFDKFKRKLSPGITCDNLKVSHNDDLL